MTKDREKIRKQARVSGHLTYKGTRIKIISESLSKTMKIKCSAVFRVMKEYHQTRNLYSTKLTSKCKGEIMTSLDEEQLKKLITGKSVLQEMLKAIHQEEGK